MLDATGRNITYLRLSVTDLCNYRCRYCMPPDGVCKRAHRDICSLEELAAMAAAAVQLGVRKIRVTGGEPLVRRGIVDLCRMLHEIPGVEELCLTTNGSLLPAYADALRAAGVDRLNISLDTLDRGRFADLTRGGNLQDVLDGLAAAERAGFSGLKLNCVLLADTPEDDIRRLAALTREKPWEVRFIELMPIGPADAAEFRPADSVLQLLPELVPCGTGSVSTRCRFPDAPGAVGLITPLSHAFCSRCDRIRITADGKLKPCLHSQQEIPLRGLTGGALLDAIRTGIAAKPAQHHLDTGHTDAARPMSAIGG